MKFRLIEEKENKKTLDLDEALGLKEDTIKQNGKWVNKGKEGTHGTFKTKKEADAQRKAMFAQGFKEELEECIYLFPELTEEDKEELHKYDLAYLGKNHFKDEISDIVKGSKEDLIRYGKEYLDYILHPDYLYREEDFAGEIVNEALYGKDEVSDFFDKAKRLGVTTVNELKDLLAQEESKGNTEKEKIDAYADAVELGDDTLSNESLKEDLNKESIEEEIRKAIREHFRTWDDEDYEDMIGEYLVVEVEDQEDGRTKVEVRAELSYATLDNIADELNKIVQKYDKDAYFDHEDSGIINAFIDKNAEGKTIDEFKPYSDEKLNSIKIPGYTNKWSAIDHMEVNGTDYYMFENDIYGDETWYLVTSNINDGPFYETYDNIETCLRDEGVLEESLKEDLKRSDISKEVEKWAKDDFEEGLTLDPNDFNEFKHLLIDNHSELEEEPDESFRKWFDYYFEVLDDVRSGDYFDAEHAEEFMERNPHGYYNSENDYGDYDDLDEKLIQGKSDATLKKNIATEIEAGKDPKQAYAIAKSVQDKHMKESKDWTEKDIENIAKAAPEFHNKIQSQVDEFMEKSHAKELEKDLIDDEIVDYFDNSVHDKDIVEDDFDEEHIEELAKKAVEESKKHTKEVGTTINENKTEVTPTQEIINESLETNEEVALDYVSPNAVDANFQAQEVDLNNI